MFWGTPAGLDLRIELELIVVVCASLIIITHEILRRYQQKIDLHTK